MVAYGTDRNASMSKPRKNVKQVKATVEQLRELCRERDIAIKSVIAARDGDYDKVAPGMLPEDFDGHALVSNLVDTAARDISEVMAPLPSVQCNSLRQNSEAAKKAAQIRSRIGQSYFNNSRLQDQMYGGTDRYASFGYMVYVVEPDFDDKMPVIRVDDCQSAYYLVDTRGRTLCYATTATAKLSELRYLYPEYAAQFNTMLPNIYSTEQQDKDCDLISYYDENQISIICEDMELLHIENPISRCPVRVVQRPYLTPGHARGQFDDVIWVQVARAMVASYTMNALEQSVNAPVVLPNDITEMVIGPLEAVQTDNPQGVGRVPLNIPQGVFPESQMLAMEQMKGSRYPEGRSGNIDASIITGQGVQALMGTFDTQIQTFQTLNSSALEDIVSMCFEMDEALWRNVEKTVRGDDEGSPYEITYVPSKDIKGDHTSTISYGAIAGLDPNRGLVFLLQAQSAGLISKETARRYLPVDLNAVAENQSIGIETMRDSLTIAIAQLAQAIPGMAAQGQDPREIVMQFADILKEIQRGSSIEEAATKVLAPKEDQQAAQDPLAALLGGGGAPGAPAEGQSTQGPSGASALLASLTGLTPGGQANMQSTVMRKQPVAA